MYHVCRRFGKVKVGLVVLLCLASPLAWALPPSKAVKELVETEQTLLSRSVDTQRIISPELNNQDAAFAPETGAEFPIKTYWIEASKLDVFAAEGLAPALKRSFFRSIGGKARIRLLVHPESEGFYRGLLDGAIPGVPLVATWTLRTLLVWDSWTGQPKRPCPQTPPCTSPSAYE